MTSAEMWAELKFKLQSAQMTYELLCDGEPVIRQSMAWAGKASMALEALLMMEYLEKSAGDVGEVVEAQVGGTGLSPSGDDVAGAVDDLARDGGTT